MCAAIIAYIPFIIVINKNILNRRAPAVKYDHKLSHRWFDDTNNI